MPLGAGGEAWFEDRFDGPDLDPDTWCPHYLPAWSSRESTRASYRLDRGGLTLDVPVDHPVWCEGDHDPPLRVSGIQSGNWSGPVGSGRGQQRFREAQVVVEEQERFEGWLPTGGRVEISARMELSRRSMAALWMSGFEDDDTQERCGELCVFEVFGRDLGPVEAPSAEVGVGIKAFRDPALTRTSRPHGSRSTSPPRTTTPWTGTPTRPSSPWTASRCGAARGLRRTRCS